MRVRVPVLRGRSRPPCRATLCGHARTLAAGARRGSTQAGGRSKTKAAEGIAASTGAWFGATMGAGLGAGWCAYDYHTMAGFRQMRPWQLNESKTRLRNALMSSWPLSQTLPMLSIEELGELDGRGATICFGARGIVYDVSCADSFKPGGAYADMMAGRDGTVALGIMSMEKEDANRTDWASLSEEERTGLDSWVDYFDQKYARVGRVLEWHASASGAEPSESSETRK